MEKTSRQAVLESVRQLRLHGFDWDGVGGLPLRGDVADTIAELYESSSDLQQDAADRLPMPIVSLNPDGTIEVLYKDDEEGCKELLLTFRCEGVITFTKMFGDGQTMVEGTIRIDMLEFDSMCGEMPGTCDDLIELFDWLAED